MTSSDLEQPRRGAIDLEEAPLSRISLQDAGPSESDGYAREVDRGGSSGGGVIRAQSHSGVSPAEWTYERLSRQIAAFEARLSSAEEVGGRVTSAPGDGSFQIEDLGWWGPDMIIFYGKNASGRPIQLIQHYTQLNVLLTAMPKATPEQAPRRIGFELAKRLRDKTPVRALDDEAEGAEL